ncbi:MAG: hypothetical protein ACR2Q4_10140 [Geminicoccaceae bacterium]
MAARAPVSFDFAVEHGYSVTSWPFTRPMAEVELYKSRLDEALTKNPGQPRPISLWVRRSIRPG